jgi:hypothetical protein
MKKEKLVAFSSHRVIATPDVSAEKNTEEVVHHKKEMVKGEYLYVKENDIEFTPLEKWYPQARLCGADGTMEKNLTDEEKALSVRTTDSCVSYTVEHNYDGTKTYRVQIDNNAFAINTIYMAQSNLFWDAYTGNIYWLGVGEGLDNAGEKTETGSVKIGDETHEMTVRTIFGSASMIGHFVESEPYDLEMFCGGDGVIKVYYLTVPEAYDGFCVAVFCDTYTIDGADYGKDADGNYYMDVLRSLITGEGGYTQENLHLFKID